jgi:hypothetical protein
MQSKLAAEEAELASKSSAVVVLRREALDLAEPKDSDNMQGSLSSWSTDERRVWGWQSAY